jgi:hypothetical protein
VLCKIKEESVDHLLVHYQFAKEVSGESLELIKVKEKCEGKSIYDCFRNWCLDRAVTNHKDLQCTVAWALRLARNGMIFQGKELLPIQVSHQVRYAYDGIWKPAETKTPRILKLLDIDYTKAWGYFDGASHGNPGICESGGILYLSTTHHFSFKVAFGQGSKKRDEMCALCMLLNLAVDKGAKSIQIMGDLKLAINWANGANKIEYLILNPIMENFREIRSRYEDIFISACVQRAK